MGSEPAVAFAVAAEAAAAVTSSFAVEVAPRLKVLRSMFIRVAEAPSSAEHGPVCASDVGGTGVVAADTN